VTGRKRWVTKTVRGGKREAQRALAAMVADNDRGGAQPHQRHRRRAAGGVVRPGRPWLLAQGRPGNAGRDGPQPAPVSRQRAPVQARRRRHRPLLPPPAGEGRAGRPPAGPGDDSSGPRHPPPRPRPGREVGMAECQPGVIGDAPSYPDTRHQPARAPRAGPAVRAGHRGRRTWPTTSSWPPPPGPAAAS
jgi:hypothetical protein